MSSVLAKLSMPGLQHRLDALAPGEQIALAASDYRRLFGVNDVAQRRIENFARGHGCVFEATPSSIIFRKAGVA